MRISVTIQSNRLGALAAAVPGKTRALVARTVLDLEAQEKQTIVAVGAVDTGELLNSVQGTLTGDTSGEVTVGAAHGRFVNDGTVRMPARPFVEPSVDVIRPQFAAGAAKLIQGL